MMNITDEKKKVINELKRRTINDVTPKMLEEDSLFYRFAKARDFNLLEAESMLRKHIAWRKEFQIDTILTDYEPPEVFVNYLVSSRIGFDKEGGVIRLNDWGRLDIKNFANFFDKKDMGKYCAYTLECDKALVIKKGGNLWKPVFVVIFDVDELTYAKAVYVKAMQKLAYAMKMLIDNFPEMVKSVTIVNAPSYFSWIYMAMKPILPTTITQKIRIYSTDGSKEFLLKGIDADVLPAYLGGNKTDPDGNPLCETFIQRGRPLPEIYCKQKEGKKLFLAPDTEKLTVRPFCKEEIRFEVKEANSYLEWEFEVQKRDIVFSLEFRDETNKMESVELIPKQRIGDSSEPERVCFKCDKVGSYVMVFDNSYSWIYWKEVCYRAGVKHTKNDDIYMSTLHE